MVFEKYMTWSLGYYKILRDYRTVLSCENDATSDKVFDVVSKV